MNTYQVVAGSSDPLDIQLLNDKKDGQGPQPFDATGMGVTMTIKPADGSTPPSVVGKVEWLDSKNSIVRFNPSTTDFKFVASPYDIRILVTDVDSKVYAYPRFVQADKVAVGL